MLKCWFVKDLSSFSISYETVYQWATTNCCFVSELLYNLVMCQYASILPILKLFKSNFSIWCFKTMIQMEYQNNVQEVNFWYSLPAVAL